MKEESDGCIREAFAEHTGQKHQMVIVNPDPIARPKLIHNRGAEPAVRFYIGFPTLRIELQPGGKTVKQRPECLVRVAS